mmetsp:Transcript_138911/g.241552  ORF Transcript_138911/g.241552 Transcript_138911/m.241552 type:complete len:80 (-) Transcript_138911:8-247(-)
MILSLRKKIVYPVEAEKYSYSQEYDQAKATKLESLTCDVLRLRANNTANPSAKAAKGDTKARLIFKIVCGQPVLLGLLG